jgi:hypothetical protein
MQKGKNIVLPLTVGLSSVTSKTPLQKVSTSEMEIQLTIKCKLLKSLYCQSASKISVKQARFEGEAVIVGCSEANSKGEFDGQIRLQEEGKEAHIAVHPFRVNFVQEGE